MQSSNVGLGTSGNRGLVSDMTDTLCYAYSLAFLQAPCLMPSIRLKKPKASRKESKKNLVGLKSGHDADAIH